MIASWSKTIQSVLACGPRALFLPTKQSARPIYSHDNATKKSSIDRFQVSHFRPVVMEIEIGGRSEKSLGGQESAAVDQECMGSNARSYSFALSFQIRLPFFAGTCLMSRATNSP